MKTVVTTLFIIEQQWSRLCLASIATELYVLIVEFRKSLFRFHSLHPAICDCSQGRIKICSQITDGRWKRVCEILILSHTKIEPRHFDPTAKFSRLLVKLDYFLTFGRG